MLSSIVSVGLLIIIAIGSVWSESYKYVDDIVESVIEEVKPAYNNCIPLLSR